MTAHVAFPNIDPSGVPATLSPVLLQAIASRRMGFQGVVCSDSLLMAGVRDRFANEGEMALATLKAGVDLLLDLREPAEVVDYLLRMCRERHARPRSASTKRSRAYGAQAKSVWAAADRIASAANLPRTMTSNECSHELRNASRERRSKSRTADASALPFDPDKPLVAILLKPFETPIDPPEQPLAAALARAVSRCEVRAAWSERRCGGV